MPTSEMSYYFPNSQFNLDKTLGMIDNYIKWTSVIDCEENGKIQSGEIKNTCIYKYYALSLFYEFRSP